MGLSQGTKDYQTYPQAQRSETWKGDLLREPRMGLSQGTKDYQTRPHAQRWDTWKGEHLREPRMGQSQGTKQQKDPADQPHRAWKEHYDAGRRFGGP